MDYYKMRNGLICNIEQIYLYVSDLKKVRRQLISNCYLDNEKLNEIVESQKLFFEYKEGSYLNLLCKDDGFLRMYFYIANLEDYQFGGIGETTVCDIFTKKEDEESLGIINKLKDYGFLQYACFQKWMMKLPENFIVNCPKGFVFGSEKSQEAVNLLYDTFDRYIDCLPRRCEIETFLKDKEFINVYEAQAHKYLGSLIYTEKKRLVTTEFYFIRPEEKGKGISYLLHDHYYQMFSKKEYQFAAWINVNNKPSIAVHEKYHYRKGMYKFTLLKKGSNF